MIGEFAAVWPGPILSMARMSPRPPEFRCTKGVGPVCVEFAGKVC